MKKNIIIALLLASATVQAQDFYAVSPSGHRLYYNITSATEHTVSVVEPTLYEDGSYYNNQFWGLDVDLVIPDTVYNGGVAYLVTGIGSQALNIPMHSLTIPRSMRTIGYHAFGTTSTYGNNNNSMRVMYFNADSLEYSGGIWAAYNYWVPTIKDCERLDTVYIGDHVKYLPPKLFTDCDSLRCVVMGDSVHTIDTNAFGFCQMLDSVRVSPALRWMGPGAFYHSVIQHIDLPDGLRYIGGGAFTDCLNLVEVIIPNTVDSIGTNCFFNCRQLQHVRLGNSMRRLPDDCFVYCYALTDMEFASSLQVIGERAFYECQALAEVVLPASIDTLKNMCFSMCSLAAIRLLGTTPPVTVGNIFSYSQSHAIPVYIPCGTYNAYHAATTWSSFPNLTEGPAYMLTVLSADETMGSAEVTTPATCTAPAIITALPDSGFRFTAWNDGDTVNPRTVALTSDTLFVALFDTLASPSPTDTVWRTVAVSSNADGAFATYGSGTYADGSTVEIGFYVTDPMPQGGHWQFLGWSDGPSETPRTIVVTSDTAIVALFEWVADSTEGIGGIESSTIRIKITPNPSHGDVTISVGEPTTVSVIDLQGRTVVPDTRVGSSLVIPHASLPAGTYIVRIGNTAMRKIVIL